MNSATLIAFSLADERCGMECREVAAVLPLAKLKTAAGGNAAIAGMLDYHGTEIPVVDLSRLMTGRPCADLLSTRILVVACGSGLAGLMVERANEAFHAATPPADGVAKEERPLVFKIALNEQGQTAGAAIKLGKLLSQTLRSSLPGAAAASHGPRDLQ